MQGSEQVLTSFKSSGQKITDWQIVDDGVMGGLSKGKFNISDDKKLKFSGNLSLEKQWWILIHKIQKNNYGSEPIQRHQNESQRRW